MVTSVIRNKVYVLPQSYNRGIMCHIEGILTAVLIGLFISYGNNRFLLRQGNVEAVKHHNLTRWFFMAMQALYVIESVLNATATGSRQHLFVAVIHFGFMVATYIISSPQIGLIYKKREGTSYILAKSAFPTVLCISIIYAYSAVTLSCYAP
jgi:hypothetical protein